uniref:transposase domain-containing protein n=1 Tax=Cupriavidus necator TaxID=106590 RepID=UPI003FA46F4A
MSPITSPRARDRPDCPRQGELDSQRGGRAAATMYSLLGTCRLNGIEPYGWLKDTLERLPADPISQVHELLPLAR